MTDEQLLSLKPGQKVKALHSKDVFEVTKVTNDAKNGLRVFVKKITNPEFNLVPNARHYDVIEEGSGAS